jgi:hypothetical protein
MFQMVQPPSQSAIQRATAIRDHLVPLIQAASAKEGINGYPLLFMAGGFIIGYREVACGTRMEVWAWGRPPVYAQVNNVGDQVIRYDIRWADATTNAFPEERAPTIDAAAAGSRCGRRRQR